MLIKHCKEYYFYKLTKMKQDVFQDVKGFKEHVGVDITVDEAIRLRKYFVLAIEESKQYDLPYIAGYKIFIDYCKGVI